MPRPAMKRPRCTSNLKRAARPRSSSERSAWRRASSPAVAASEARQTWTSPSPSRGAAGLGSQASGTGGVDDAGQVRPQIAAELLEHEVAVLVQEEVPAGELDVAELAPRLLLPRLHLPGG